MENMILDAKQKAAEDCDATYITVDEVSIESSPSRSYRGSSGGYVQSARETRSGPALIEQRLKKNIRLIPGKHPTTPRRWAEREEAYERAAQRRKKADELHA